MRGEISRCNPRDRRLHLRRSKRKPERRDPRNGGGRRRECLRKRSTVLLAAGAAIGVRCTCIALPRRAEMRMRLVIGVLRTCRRERPTVRMGKTREQAHGSLGPPEQREDQCETPQTVTSGSITGRQHNQWTSSAKYIGRSRGVHERSNIQAGRRTSVRALHRRRLPGSPRSLVLRPVEPQHELEGAVRRREPVALPAFAGRRRL